LFLQVPVVSEGGHPLNARSSSSKESAAVKKPVVKATPPASKPAVKKTAAVKQAAHPTEKASVAKSAPPAAKPKAASASAPSAKSAAVGSSPESSASPIPMKKAAVASDSSPAATATAPAASVPARSTRPSSRLSQLTVPSMPQAVASTAAKSSFVQLPSSSVVPQPPAVIKKDPKLANHWKTKSAEQLTDAEVIAMPDSEYMNEKQTAFFRLKLEGLRRGILDNAGETTEHLREDTVVVPDPADRATIEEEHALELRTRDRERKLLKKIEQSIQRLDAGDYGYCDETGEPIGVGRLLARPTATLSLEAQQRRELKQKMFGD
jgi:DnaK suppressor protein